jgi:molybdenum cofactor guanylyltransferase
MAIHDRPISAVILAGGRSRRMGTAKAALDFGGLPIILRLVVELGRVADDVIVVAAPKESEPYCIEQVLARRLPAITLLRDRAAFAGPVDALSDGLRTARHDVVFACSCDLPLLRADVALGLCAMLSRHDAAIPQIQGRLQPLCAAYHQRCSRVLAEMSAQGERRLSAVVTKLDVRRVAESELRPIDPKLTSFLNVNTPEDYSRALQFVET